MLWATPRYFAAWPSVSQSVLPPRAAGPAFPATSARHEETVQIYPFLKCSTVCVPRYRDTTCSREPKRRSARWSRRHAPGSRTVIEGLADGDAGAEGDDDPRHADEPAGDTASSADGGPRAARAGITARSPSRRARRDGTRHPARVRGPPASARAAPRSRRPRAPSRSASP